MVQHGPPRTRAYLLLHGYSTPKVPVLLREGANRAYHEAIGELMSLASGQRPYLKSVGLLSDAAAKADP